MRQITINCPEELFRRFKAHCATEGTTMTAVLIEKIREFIDSGDDTLHQDRP